MLDVNIESGYIQTMHIILCLKLKETINMQNKKIKLFRCRFEVISISATKEEQLRKSLQNMKDDWKTITLSTSPYKYD